MNFLMSENFNTDSKASECIKYKGTITYKGSNREENISSTAFWYCKYDSGWYLVRNQ